MFAVQLKTRFNALWKTIYNVCIFLRDDQLKFLSEDNLQCRSDTKVVMIDIGLKNIELQENSWKP